MQSYKINSRDTQVHWTCKALLDQREISHATDIRELYRWRFGAIIHRLKSDYGWPIETRYRSLNNVATCSLPSDTDHTALRFPPSASALSNVEGVQ